MKNIGYTLLLSTLLFSSCVRDEVVPCPPLTVNIAVKDKNYFNVDKVELEEKKSEDLAFREYVPTLYYQLRDAATGNVVEEKGVFNVAGDDKTLSITLSNRIPHGKYVLTVWGGLKDNAPLGDDPLAVILHEESMEDGDYYMTNDTLIYDAWNYTHTAELERTKGKLIVQVENLPENVNYMGKQISGLLQHLDCEFNYSGITSVKKSFEWGSEPEIITQTLLSPSHKEKGSVVDVDFFDDAAKATPTLSPKNVSITMKRNELTVLKYVYDDEKGEFAIYILMNDSWDVIYDMDIN